MSQTHSMWSRLNRHNWRSQGRARQGVLGWLDFGWESGVLSRGESTLSTIIIGMQVAAFEVQNELLVAVLDDHAVRVEAMETSAGIGI